MYLPTCSTYRQSNNKWLKRLGSRNLDIELLRSLVSWHLLEGSFEDSLKENIHADWFCYQMQPRSSPAPHIARGTKRGPLLK